MAAVRLRNLKGLPPGVRQRIRATLRSQPHEITEENAFVANQQPSKSKWRNVRTTVDGITFASKREAKRYGELKIELLAGEITDLERQKPFRLDVNGVHICDYIVDFLYRRNGAQITEDAKGKATELYRIKKALMRAIYGIEILET